MRGSSEAGYGLLEILIATCIMGLVTGAIFQVIGGGQSVFRTQPDVADVHQRLRIAIDMIYQDLE